MSAYIIMGRLFWSRLASHKTSWPARPPKLVILSRSVHDLCTCFMGRRMGARRMQEGSAQRRASSLCAYAVCVGPRLEERARATKAESLSSGGVHVAVLDGAQPAGTGYHQSSRGILNSSLVQIARSVSGGDRGAGGGDHSRAQHRAGILRRARMYRAIQRSSWPVALLDIPVAESRRHRTRALPQFPPKEACCNA